MGIIAAGACAFIDFRVGAVVLAIVPAGLAAIRSLPVPWDDVWTNRSRGVDIATCLLFTLLLVTLAFVVPLTR